MIWPESQASFRLAPALSAENPGGFSPIDGHFYQTQSEPCGEGVAFYWLFSAPVLVNHCREYCCRIDRVVVPWGQARVLKPGMEIQIGHFQFQVQHHFGTGNSNEAVSKRVFSDVMNGYSPALPELEGVLPHMGQHVVWQEAFMAENPLKNLAQEYQNVVLWGPQRHTQDAAARRSIKNSAPESHHFQTQRDKMDNQTVTDCILGTSSLIDKACQELDLSRQSDILSDDRQKQDILLLVAPGHLKRKPATTIPSLMLQDLYKTGLDTLL